MSTYFKLHDLKDVRIVKEVADYCDDCGQVEWLCICKGDSNE